MKWVEQETNIRKMRFGWKCAASVCMIGYWDYGAAHRPCKSHRFSAFRCVGMVLCVCRKTNSFRMFCIWFDKYHEDRTRTLWLFDRMNDRYFSNETDEARTTKKFQCIQREEEKKITRHTHWLVIFLNMQRTTTKIIVILSNDKNYRESSERTALYWIVFV